MALVLFCSTAHAGERDPWFSEDKAFHFASSGTIAIGGYFFSTAFAESTEVRIAYGASVSLLAGIGKELWDASGNGDPSWKDLTWDLLGTAVGIAICWTVDWLIHR